MFIMGVVGRAMGSGQFSANDIILLTREAAAAWKGRHSAAPGAPQSLQQLETPGELNDEIPF
jgi:hypothetical protein